jgi:hypothetical protein
MLLKGWMSARKREEEERMLVDEVAEMAPDAAKEHAKRRRKA